MVDMPYEGRLFALSLDFNQTILEKILEGANTEVAGEIRRELDADSSTPRTIEFTGYVAFGVRARLGELQSVQNEQFIPLVAQELLSLGRGGVMAKEKDLRAVMDGCNHKMAKALLIKQFSCGVIPRTLIALLDEYVVNPCTETAMKLVQFDPNLISVFELARGGSFTSFLFGKGDLTADAKTTKMLRNEPEFEEYCNSIAEATEQHKQLKAQLRSKGYSDQVIDDAFSEYWRDMATDI